MPHFDFDIFLSFSSRDEAEARPLYEQLTASGLRVFWSDESLEGSIGESWYNEIGESLQSSRHLVLLWTAAAAKSKFVELEYSRFHSATIQERGRFLVPLLGRGVSPATLPFLLGNIQCFSIEEDLTPLIKRLGGKVDGYANQEVSYATDGPPVETPLTSTTDVDAARPNTGSAIEETATPNTGQPAGGVARTLTDEHGMEFILIDPGTFMMGDNNISEAKPAREVAIVEQPFYLGKYPVTQAQWRAVMGTNPSRYKGDTHPVDQVSWDEVQAFLAKISPGYRLPTEAEWEYACRAGTATAYSFGDNKHDLDLHAWHRQNAGDTHHPVGQKTPNPWGLYDMHGNVYEWVEDRYGSGTNRVIRGGSWSHFFKDLRSAARTGMRPNSKYSYLGFRVVKEVES